MLYGLLSILIILITKFNANAKIVNITVTSNNINLVNFGNIVNQILPLSVCPSTYSISIIPFNQTPAFVSPVNKNNYIPSIHLVFGPQQFYTPSYFGFNPIATLFKFPNAYILDSFMSLQTRLTLMLAAVNSAIQNDPNKIVVFILNGSIVDPLQPWKSFNPMPYLSTFKGALNIQLYNNTGDGVTICYGILLSQTVTIAMDLSRSGALEVLSACNDRNLLNWRMRWLVFFSMLSYVNQSSFSNLPLRQNFTLYDFTHTTEINNPGGQNLAEEQDIVLSDIAYTVVRLMDYSECGYTSTSNLQLRTGLFSFANGVVTRLNWLLDIYRSSGTLLTNAGSVTITNGNIVINLPTIPPFNNTTPFLLLEMRAKVFRIAAMSEAPFAFYTAQNGSLISTGYSIDMITTIMNNINVTYNITFYNLSNGILSNGKLNGMLGLLQNGQTDLVIGPITQNLNYTTYVDFTSPFLTYKIAIIYRNNETNIYTDMFQFIFAFKYYIWIAIIGCCFIYAIALMLVNMISPNAANFGFLYSFLFTMGSMVQGVTTALPDKISGRILVVFWWIFNIAVLLAYVATYGAILTNQRMQANITQLSSLVQQNRYSFATVASSAIDYYLQTSPSADIQNVNQVMRSQYSSLMYPSVDTALINVRNKTNPFAFIYLDLSIDQFLNETCMVIAQGTDQFNLSYALQLNSDFTNIINIQLAALNPNFTQTLYTKYFPVITPTVCQISTWLDPIINILDYVFLPNAPYSLTMHKMSGVFVIMLVGIIIAIFIAFIEFIVRKCKNIKRKPKK